MLILICSRRRGHCPRGLRSLGENAFALPALDDCLEQGALFDSVYGGGGPKLQEAEMIYTVIVNECGEWVAELCRAGGKAGCLLTLAVCALKMWCSKQTHQGLLELLPAPSMSFVFSLLELCVPDATSQALTVGLVLSQTKGIHVGGCFHLASITVKVGYHQLFSYRGLSPCICGCQILLLQLASSVERLSLYNLFNL